MRDVPRGSWRWAPRRTGASSPACCPGRETPFGRPSGGTRQVRRLPRRHSATRQRERWTSALFGVPHPGRDAPRRSSQRESGSPVGAPRQRAVPGTPPRRGGREFRDAAGRGQDAPGRGRDAPETRDAAGTRKKRRQRPPRDRTHDHERRPRDRTQTRRTRETRERRSPDAGRRPRRRPDAARRGRDAPDAAKTRLPRRAGDAGGPGGDCPGT